MTIIIFDWAHGLKKFNFIKFQMSDRYDELIQRNLLNEKILDI